MLPSYTFTRRTMSLNESTVTMKLGDYQRLDRDIQTHKAEVSRLSRELETAKIDGDVDGLARKYLEAFMAAMPIVRFAVGNMDPMSFRGWPYKELEKVIVALKNLPGTMALSNSVGTSKTQLVAQSCRRSDSMAAWSRSAGEERSAVQTGSATRLAN
jgi:hypothetical protein